MLTAVRDVMVRLDICVWERVVLGEVNMVTMSRLRHWASLRPLGSEKACLATLMSGHLSDGLILVRSSIQLFRTTVLEFSLCDVEVVLPDLEIEHLQIE
jgi:hypothetical protein